MDFNSIKTKIGNAPAKLRSTPRKKLVGLGAAVVLGSAGLAYACDDKTPTVDSPLTSENQTNTEPDILLPENDQETVSNQTTTASVQTSTSTTTIADPGVITISAGAYSPGVTAIPCIVNDPGLGSLQVRINGSGIYLFEAGSDFDKIQPMDDGTMVSLEQGKIYQCFKPGQELDITNDGLSSAVKKEISDATVEIVGGALPTAANSLTLPGI
jgi:hypothetical protein